MSIIVQLISSIVAPFSPPLSTYMMYYIKLSTKVLQLYYLHSVCSIIVIADSPALIIPLAFASILEFVVYDDLAKPSSHAQHIGSPLHSNSSKILFGAACDDL